jgi:hypothetical protein
MNSIKLKFFAQKYQIRSAFRGAYLFWGLLVFVFPGIGMSQGTVADSLRFVQDMPYICDNLVFGPAGMERNESGSGCGDPIFWRAVQGKAAIIPLLIRKLRDTTITEATVPNFGGNYAVGDVAWSALQEIVHGLPGWGPIGIGLLGVEFDRHNCGSCAYWNHLRADPKNRVAFSKSVKKWYRRHRKELVWVKSERFETCDGCRNHPNGGHFELEDGK